MPKTKLLIINGLPGTGKTTLATKLSKDLKIAYMGKDMLKEFFFDTLNIEGREQSRTIGKAVSQMLYILVREYLANDLPLIIESAFFAEFARPEFANIIAEYSPTSVEIYCSTSKDIRRQRFIDRANSGERHQGHMDAANLPNDDTPEPLEDYAPLEVCRIVNVNTDSFGETEYQKLLSELKQILDSEA